MQRAVRIGTLRLRACYCVLMAGGLSLGLFL
nr:MAG TPA: hypothetical protein [Bacteriophage sp.]DAM51334.1 MAG TPA: hypothetical protein [Caudoviricetes sp.]DAV64640.1 MAG TPA: hypothetical protein [Caudoviricetes sp.]DAX62676.1 MAG TPA: hypothetical protein [Caudoviricetes sp.]